MQNGFIGSFNGGLRDECLNEKIFDSLDDARRKLGLWRALPSCLTGLRWLQVDA
ncbi:Integrase core domain [Puniceibacterium sp. IMCC21224]|jgi:hypothetical protein|nr:Integrase core domain [Puniceibacterium sp. IMCC21224]